MTYEPHTVIVACGVNVETFYDEIGQLQDFYDRMLRLQLTNNSFDFLCAWGEELITHPLLPADYREIAVSHGIDRPDYTLAFWFDTCLTPGSCSCLFGPYAVYSLNKRPVSGWSVYLQQLVSYNPYSLTGVTTAGMTVALNNRAAFPVRLVRRSTDAYSPPKVLFSEGIKLITRAI